MILCQALPNIGCFYGFFYVVRKREGMWRICSHESSAIITFGVLRWTQWLRGLRRGSAVDRFLSGLWVWIQMRTWMSVCCECCVLSGRGLCVGLITRPEESYRLWCVKSVWSWNLNNEEIRPTRDYRAMEKSFFFSNYFGRISNMYNRSMHRIFTEC